MQNIVMSMPAYLRNHAAELHQILCLLSVAVSQSSDGVGSRYALPVFGKRDVFAQHGRLYGARRVETACM